jgi:hypothetical protein
MVFIMKQSFRTLNFFALISSFSYASQLHAAGQWTDVTDGTATYDGTSALVLTDKHTYRPTSATAWVGSDVTLPAAAVVTIGASSVPNFAGNTYTQLTVASSGKLTLYGADGVTEVVTSLIKSAKGGFVLEDRTSGGLTLTAFTANTDAEVGNITINTFGAGTTLTLGVTFIPAGTAQALTINIDDAAVISLATITSIPRLTGKGVLKLTASIMSIPLTEIARISNFKGTLITASGGTTDLVFSSDSYIWTLSGVTEIPYSVIKVMKGTVRLPATTKVTFY